MKTPVLFIAFNRPEITKQTFEKIRRYQPTQLFIAIDGPRKDKPDDSTKIDEVKKIILNSIDWECDIKKRIQKNNLGCGYAPSEAISWFFEYVTQGIIIEDDCICEEDFFSFCEKMLDAYQKDEKVMHVAGSNFLKKTIHENAYMSKYNPVWGWATWKRAWQHFSFDINYSSKEDFKAFEKEYVFSSKEKKQWKRIFEMINHSQRKDIWDYQWTYHIWKNKGICIQSGKNLVSNIGFGKESTHMRYLDYAPKVGYLPIEPLKTNKYIIKDSIAINYDTLVFKNYYDEFRPPLFRRIKNSLYKLSPPLYQKVKNIFR